jgi:hypothetical protein
LIAEYCLICGQPCSTPFVGFVSQHWFQNLLSVLFPSVLNFDSQFLFL